MATQTLSHLERDQNLEEDVGNIVLMEHVKLQVDNQQTASLFYLVGLGFTRDPHMMVGPESMWVNLGEQQFHLATNSKNQVLRGHVGIVVPSLEALTQRLEAVAPKLTGTKFAWSHEGDYIAATCPWGNQFRLYEPSASFGPMTLGTAYVQFSVPRGTSDGIADFYDKVMGALSGVEETADAKRAVVKVGQYQHLIFQEMDDVPDYDGHHIAVYIANFSKPYRWLAQRGLVTEEPSNHQFRFVDITNVETGEKLYSIEHEVRGMYHVLFRRPLVNRIAGEYMEPRRVNGQTTMRTVM